MGNEGVGGSWRAEATARSSGMFSSHQKQRFLLPLRVKENYTDVTIHSPSPGGQHDPRH